MLSKSVKTEIRRAAWGATKTPIPQRIGDETWRQVEDLTYEATQLATEQVINRAKQVT